LVLRALLRSIFKFFNSQLLIHRDIFYNVILFNINVNFLLFFWIRISTKCY
jgi:hypothetical protein